MNPEPKAQPGYVLVPVTPTLEMIKAATGKWMTRRPFEEVYAALVEAAHMVACESCNGHGIIHTGYSGLESDGNAPLSEICEDCGGKGMYVPDAAAPPPPTQAEVQPDESANIADVLRWPDRYFIDGNLVTSALLWVGCDEYEVPCGGAHTENLKRITLGHCLCPACKDGLVHASDCAVHNEPAMPNEPCDCQPRIAPPPGVSVAAQAQPLDDERQEQARQQCLAVAHMAKALQLVHEARASILARSALDLTEAIGESTAYIMESLGYMLSNMDAVDAEEDAWLDPVFEAAHKMWPQSDAALTPPAARAGEPSKAAQDVLAERRRQISAKGWTPEHDDEHSDGALAIAAACYAEQAVSRAWLFDDGPDNCYAEDGAPRIWPWDREWWKPKNPRRDLVRAGALLLAEIERLDRAASVAFPAHAPGVKGPEHG